MSHANAALTPRARLRLARLIVDHGWSPARAAERYDVSWRTANKWAQRYRDEREAGMTDRSSRPHRQPNRTPAPVERAIVHLRTKRRLGPVPLAAHLGLAPSTVHAVLRRRHLNRLSHLDRATGEPIRRYEHQSPGDLLHVDVKKLGNVPDGGGWRYLGRQTGDRNRQAPPAAPAGAAATTTRSSAPPTPKYTTTKPRSPLSASSAARSPGSPHVASPPDACCPTTARPTNPGSGPAPAPTSASP